MDKAQAKDESGLIKYDKPLSAPIERVSTLVDIMTLHEAKFRPLLPKWSGVTWERIVSATIETANADTKILRCSASSVLLSIKAACELGLSHSKTMGEAYLIPYGSKCTLIIGYRGLAKLARRASTVTGLDCEAVFKGDQFEVWKGTNPRIIHGFDTTLKRQDNNLTHVYAVAYYKDAPEQFVVMTRSQVEYIRSQTKGDAQGPWAKYFRAMAIKTAIRQLCKYMEWAPEREALIEMALEHDNRTSGVILDIDEGDPDEKWDGVKRKLTDGKDEKKGKKPVKAKKKKAPPEKKKEEDSEAAPPSDLGEESRRLILDEIKAGYKKLKVGKDDPFRVNLDARYKDHPELLSNYLRDVIQWNKDGKPEDNTPNQPPVPKAAAASVAKKSPLPPEDVGEKSKEEKKLEEAEEPEPPKKKRRRSSGPSLL